MMKKISLGILLFLWNSIWLSGCSTKEEMVFFSSGTANPTYEEHITQEAGGEEVARSLLVYVCGAVQEPGVVALEENARVVDAIVLAGGMTGEADATYVNLAAKITDGEKIYVPTVAEVVQWETQEAEDTLVNINTADKTELSTLPGIGESKAEDIIAYREKNGSFQSKEELMNISGIKENLFEKIAEKIKVE